MTPGATLVMLAGVHAAAVMSPGPNTVLVIQNAAKDRRLGLLTALGFWPAGAFWAAVGLAGLGSVLAVAPWLALGLRIVCGSYLLFLGAKFIAGSFGPRAEERGGGPVSWPRALASGFLTNVTNPKSIAYYMSVFAATGALALPAADQVIAIVLLPSIGFLFYGSLALLMSSAWMRRMYRSASRWLDRIAGAAMFAFGFKLLSAR